MTMNINDKINETMNQDQIRELKRNVLNKSYDQRWCRQNGIDYLNPNTNKIKEIIYDLTMKC